MFRPWVLLEQARSVASLRGTWNGISSFESMMRSLGHTLAPHPLCGQTILIADDDQVVADVLATRLVDLGANVVTSTTAEDALGQAQRTDLSLCVMDLEIRCRETVRLGHLSCRRRVPFVHTGLYHRPDIMRWASMPLVFKPDECGEVARTVVRLSEKQPSWPCPVS